MHSGFPLTKFFQKILISGFPLAKYFFRNFLISGFPLRFKRFWDMVLQWAEVKRPLIGWHLFSLWLRRPLTGYHKQLLFIVLSALLVEFISHIFCDFLFKKTNCDSAQYFLKYFVTIGQMTYKEKWNLF